MSNKFSLNRADVWHWLKIQALFLLPAFLAFVPVIIGWVPKDVSWGIYVVYILNALVGLAKLWVSENHY